MSLTIAHERILKSIGIARDTELELFERLRDIARDFVVLKEEIANAGFAIKKWIRENLPRSYEWLQCHVRLFAEWDKFLICLQWADDTRYPRTSIHRSWSPRSDGRLRSGRGQIEVTSA